MDDKYDTIIIGSGCGGAAAAALSSYHGRKTLLLEQSKYIGGRACTIEKKGFKMDHGHIVGRGPKGPHGDILRMVKCEDLMPKYVSSLDLSHRIDVLDQKGGPVIGGVDQGMIGRFKVRTMGFVNLLKSKYFSLADVPGIVKFFYKMRFMNNEDLKNLDHVDLHTFISQYTNNEFVHTMLGAMSSVGFGVLPFETSAGELLRTMQIMRKDSAGGYPVTGEGISAIPKSFLNAAKRHGAEIMTKTPVESIVVENGEVKGVIVRGEFIQSNMVISNAGIKETAFKLVGKDHFEKEYIEYLENLRYSYGGISLKYALDKPIVNFQFGGKVAENFNQNMRDALEGRVPKEACIMLVCTSNIDSSLAPPGKQVLVAISPGPAIEPGKINWDPWVENLKTQIEEEFVPNISKHTIFCDVSTPDVIARQNKRFLGDAIGVAQSMNQVGDNTPSSISPIKGLYNVGADVGSKGIATEMATQSTIDLFKDLKDRNLLS